MTSIRLGKRDWLILFLLITIALILRVAFVHLPAETVFDESYYARFAHSYERGTASFYDIHPPLGKLIFYLAGKMGGGFEDALGEAAFQPYPPRFPYVAMRGASVLGGILLVPIIFLLALQLGMSRRAAFLAASFVTLENSLILYSRLILLDIWLLLFSFSAVLFGLMGFTKGKGERRSAVYRVSSAVLAGLALGVKWTAIFPLLFMMVVFIERRLNALRFLEFLLIAAIVYIAVFGVHFGLLTGESRLAAVSLLNSHPEVEVSRNLERWPHTLREPALFVAYFLGSNLQASFASFSLQGETLWYQWPLMLPAFTYWQKNNLSISFIGNPAIWLGGLVGVVAMVLAVIGKRKVNGVKPWALATAGYLLAWLPFSLVGQPMRIYSYLSALIFLILNFAQATDVLSQKFSPFLWRAVLVLTVLGFLTVSPSTYGLKNESVARVIETWSRPPPFAENLSFCNLRKGLLLVAHEGNCDDLR